MFDIGASPLFGRFAAVFAVSRTVFIGIRVAIAAPAIGIAAEGIALYSKDGLSMDSDSVESCDFECFRCARFIGALLAFTATAAIPAITAAASMPPAATPPCVAGSSILNPFCAALSVIPSTIDMLVVGEILGELEEDGDGVSVEVPDDVSLFDALSECTGILVVVAAEVSELLEVPVAVAVAVEISVDVPVEVAVEVSELVEVPD
jgi:hypothetical protein